ncbi:ketoacyl-ACP synthase III [Myxococcus sp. MxC21-1]|uniref:3-oxoacyl-ACP synthase III family protein n=1 Tax=Myxococcus sp. MxC21-1 TaxID=3041439 RepID=UPI00292F9743|nr:ketoacyl-ACP synthase III [Myxococcus sp. MxC21-1]WNZ63131.1 ketoacyl-ACP synthase III [Myxococcus sp. MxC21-1]
MYLHALGHFHPPNLLTNAFFEELGLETSDAWIVDRVGIRTRHTVLPLDYLRETRNRDVRAAQEAALFSNAETGRRAALMALERAGLKPSDIGLVVAGGCSPDECIPAESNRVAQLLNIQAPAVDLQSACSSFCMQLHFLAGMRPERLPDYVLVVNMDNSTRVVDYTDRSSAVLWGDGASAAILSPRVPGRWQLTETLLAGDPSGADKVRVPRMGHFTQNGGEVQKFAIRRAGRRSRPCERASWSVTRTRARGPSPSSGTRPTCACWRPCSGGVWCRTRGTSSMCTPGEHRRRRRAGVLSEHWDDPAVGDAVVLSVVGSGLTWAGALLERTPAR